MTNSATAKRLGINNKPTASHLSNMAELAKHIFEPIREYFGVPIYVSSGYRSVALNKAIKGSTTSQHSIGESMDIDMDNTSISNKDIFEFIKTNLNFDQLIWEFGNNENPSWVHVSYKKTFNRKQILRAVKKGKKTTYEKY